MRGEALVEVARAWIKSYMKPHCSSRTDEVMGPAAGGGDMDLDRKLEQVSRDVCECWFGVTVSESVGRWPWYGQKEEAGVIGP